MSYQLPRTRARVNRKLYGMGGFMDTITDYIQSGGDPQYSTEHYDPKCMESANKVVAAADAQQTDLVKNWNPTGIYSVKDFDTIYRATQALLQNASKALDRATGEDLAEGARDQIKIGRTNIQIQMSISEMPGFGAGEAKKWWDALQEARAKGIEYIDAPGLKRWVTRSMREANEGIVRINYVMCTKPWFVGALSMFMSVFNTLYAVCRFIAGFTIDVVKSAGKAVLSIPDALSTAVKIAKWGVVAGAAYWLYTGGHKKLVGK